MGHRLITMAQLSADTLDPKDSNETIHTVGTLSGLTLTKSANPAEDSNVNPGRYNYIFFKL